jgi:hypothetical protein
MSKNIISNKSPNLLIEDTELIHSFYSFCTFCFLYYGKKVNFATIFTKILQDDKLRYLYKLTISEPSDFEALRKFILFEPSITKSKYITKIINKKIINFNK